MKKRLCFPVPCILILCLTIVLASCSGTKKLRYFQDLPETDRAVPVAIAPYTDPVIQPDDILSINVNTTEPAATASINSRNGIYVNSSSAQSGSANPLTGYLINKEGEVDIPVLGKVKLAGLTTIQAREVVRLRAVNFFNNPVADVRFSNFKVTVIGEVNRPATYVLPNEQVSVLDAIGYAGDLSVYGRRSNILLIRKTTDHKDFTVKLDLTKKELLNSPYFYLRQNDVIYVEPLPTKTINNDTNFIKYLSLVATLFTAVILGKRYL
jgi:polysaccharide export outer membrane protein